MRFHARTTTTNADLKISSQYAVTGHTRASACLNQLSVTISTCVVAHRENVVSYLAPADYNEAVICYICQNIVVAVIHL